MPYAHSHHLHVHEGTTHEIADQSEIDALIANELEDGEERSETAFREAGEAIRRVWDFIFSDTAGRPVTFGQLEVDNPEADRKAVRLITRNLFIITLMIRPERLDAFNTIRSLSKLLDVSHETLSRIQLRASESLNFHARSQRVRPTATALHERLKRNKGSKKK